MCKYVLFVVLTVVFISGIYIIYSVKDDIDIVDEQEIPRDVAKKKIRHHIPKIMLDLYEKRKSFDNLSKADVVRSLIPKMSDKLPEQNADSHLLIFDIPATRADEEFLNAELRILTIVQASSMLKTGVERLIKIWIYSEEKRDMVCLEEFQISHKNNTWLNFNITTTVSQILQQETQNKTLKVIVSIVAFWSHYETSSGQLHLSLMPISDNYEHEYPLLLMSYISKTQKQQDEVTTRKKRSVEEDYEEETNNVWDEQGPSKKKLKRYKNICRKKSLYIDFEEIHYDDWIVQPKGYEAYQCQGKCFYPVADHLHPTKHAIMQTILHSMAPSRVQRSCCVPTRLSAISVLYIDDDGVLTYRYAYSDMVVAECGCR